MWQFLHAPAWLRARITQKVSQTAQFNASAYAGRAAVVWVDAGHSLHSCVDDSMMAFELVAPGGYVLWDDVSAA